MEKQPYLPDLKLGKLLSTKFYKDLPIEILPPVVTVKELQRYAGYYINPDKTIDIYGRDKVGISLDKFWKNLVVRDLYNRPRRFLALLPDYTAQLSFRPQIDKSTTRFEVYNDRGHYYHYLMPVCCSDLRPGDIRPLGEDSTETEVILSTQQVEGGMQIYLMNHLMEFGMEFWSDDDLFSIRESGEDWFYTIVPVRI